jgi:hypothetical protein
MHFCAVYLFLLLLVPIISDEIIFYNHKNVTHNHGFFEGYTEHALPRSNHSSHHNHNHHHHNREANVTVEHKPASLDYTTHLKEKSGSTSRNIDTGKSHRKIAFLFLVKQDLSLREIWEEFFSFHAPKHQYNIYIHSSFPFTYPETSIFHNRTIAKQITVKWGTLGLVKATRFLMEAAYNDDPDNYYFPLFSESCLPLYSFSKMYRVLLHNPSGDLSIITACPHTEEGNMEVNRWKPSLDNSPNMKKEYWRKSGEWIMLIRKHAKIYIDFVEDDQYWESIPCADEHFLPSILALHHVENETTCSDGFTSVYWTSLIASHPHTYSSSEIDDELIYHLKFGKLLDFHAHPEHEIIGLNNQCSHYYGICHFANRKFNFLSKFHLFSKLHLLLMDDRDDIYYTPNNPPSSFLDYSNITSKGNSFLNLTSINSPYLGFDYEKRLFPNLRRKEDTENNSTYYYIDLGYLREFADSHTMKFFLRIPFSISEKELNKKIPILSSKEIASIPHHVHAFFPTISEGSLMKARRSNTVWFIQGYERHAVPNMDTLYALNANPNIQTVADAHLEEIPVGDPIRPI